MTGTTLDAVLARAQDGDDSAFAELVERFHAAVVRWAFLGCDDQDEAEDVAQQVWIKVYRDIKTVRVGGAFQPWLYQVTARAAAGVRRTQRRRSILLALHMTAAEMIPAPPADNAGDEFRAEVFSRLSGLPVRQREVFSLSDLEGRTTAEVSAMLQIPEATVRSNLFKARRAMRRALLNDDMASFEERKP